MIHTKEIRIDTAQLETIREKIPASDFVNKQYDAGTVTETQNVLFILSTQRSGSTMLAGLLHKNSICLPHEYMQPYEYMPLLAERWACIENGVLNKESYVRNLLQHRTYPTGWLGVNLHGSHLKFFMRMSDCLSGIQLHFVHLVREDLVAQAVSYEIARQTGQWTTSFGQETKPDYSFEGIKDKLESIQKQNALIKAYLKSVSAPSKTIYYESLIADPESILRLLPCVTKEQTLEIDTSIKKQSTTLNAEWSERFSNEYLQYQTERSGKLGWFKKVYSGLK